MRELRIAPADLLAIAAGVALATIDLQANHTNFTVNNILACLICTDVLQLIGLRSFRAAAVMLAGLLVYDVFWVFGSPAVRLFSGSRMPGKVLLLIRCLMTT